MIPQSFGCIGGYHELWRWALSCHYLGLPLGDNSNQLSFQRPIMEKDQTPKASSS